MQYEYKTKGTCSSRILFDVEDVGLLFDVILHLGTMIAIFAVYYKDLWKMIREGFAILADVCRNIGIFFSNAANKKKGGYQRSIALSKEYGLYRQPYCGCEFSRRQAEREGR